MRSISLSVCIRLGSLFALCAASSCVDGSTEQAPHRMGRLEVALTATSSSGVQYRLRNGTFKLTGASTRTLSTDAQPDSPTLTAELPAGGYSIELVTGWSLQKRTASGSFESVKAVLGSANPVALTIVDQQTTSALFRFKVGNDVVQFGNGRLVVHIEVDDCQPDASDGCTLNTDGGGGTGGEDAGVVDSGSDQDATQGPDAGNVSLLVDSNLPPARLAADYSFRLTAHGGTWPYRFAISGGSLPPGFSLSESGRISGRADREGTFEFQVTASDAAHGVGVQTLSLTLTSQRWVALQPYYHYYDRNSDPVIDTRNFTIYLLDTATFAETVASSSAVTEGGRDRVAEGFSPGGAYFVYRDLDKHLIRDTSGPALGNPIEIGDWASSEFSPDSRWLARLTAGELILASSSAPSNKAQIPAAGCSTLQWAPDGSKLSYACNGSLYLVEPDAPVRQAQKFADGSARGWISPTIYALAAGSGKLAFARFSAAGSTVDVLDAPAVSLELGQTAENRAVFHDTSANRDLFVDFDTKATHEQIAASYSPHLKFFASWRGGLPETTLDVFPLTPVANEPVASVATTTILAWSPTDAVLATRLSDTTMQFTFLDPPRLTQQFPELIGRDAIPDVEFGKADGWAVLSGRARHKLSMAPLDRSSSALIEVPGNCCSGLTGAAPNGDFVVFQGGGETLLHPVSADGFGNPSLVYAYNTHYFNIPGIWWTPDSRYLLMETDGSGDAEVRGTLPRSLSITDTSNPASWGLAVDAFEGQALQFYNDLVQVQP